MHCPLPHGIWRGEVKQHVAGRRAGPAPHNLAPAPLRPAPQELKKELKPLTEWWKALLGDKVSGVKVSNRLDVTPCVVVTGQYGNSANMERIQRYQVRRGARPTAGQPRPLPRTSHPPAAPPRPAPQAFNGPNKDTNKAQRTLEINPRHPLVQGLKAQVAAEPEGSETREAALVLFETALLESGFDLDDNRGFSRRVYQILADNLKTDASVEPSPAEPAAAGKAAAAKEAAAEPSLAEKEEL